MGSLVPGVVVLELRPYKRLQDSNPPGFLSVQVIWPSHMNSSYCGATSHEVI
jgi:hypothetical protein